jgi:hypothetical protein
MSGHTKALHVFLKKNNYEFIEQLVQEYGVKSKAAALNRLLDHMRQYRAQQQAMTAKAGK